MRAVRHAIFSGGRHLRVDRQHIRLIHVSQPEGTHAWSIDQPASPLQGHSSRAGGRVPPFAREVGDRSDRPVSAGFQLVQQSLFTDPRMSDHHRELPVEEPA